MRSILPLLLLLLTFLPVVHMFFICTIILFRGLPNVSQICFFQYALCRFSHGPVDANCTWLSADRVIWRGRLKGRGGGGQRSSSREGFWNSSGGWKNELEMMVRLFSHLVQHLADLKRKWIERKQRFSEPEPSENAKEQRKTASHWTPDGA